jgi:NTE family protein
MAYLCHDGLKEMDMGRKVVLLLQGGSALGAFQCGAWDVLARFIRDNGHELVAVAGASIGALNAAMIARHYRDEDGGRRRLREFWRRRLAMPQVTFIPLPGAYWRAWNGLLTGLLIGNRGLFDPAYPNWHPLSELFRFHMPLYRTGKTEQTLADEFGTYDGRSPLLAVAATDVQSGEGILFNSAAQTITPRMLAASMAIPMIFPPVEIDGRHYWDFEMRSNTLLPHVLALLRQADPLSDASERILVIVVDMLRKEAEGTPDSTMQSHYRLINIMLGGKLPYDKVAVETGNAYLDALERLREQAAAYPDSPLGAAIESEYRKARAHAYAHVDVLHVGRRNLEFEYISRDFDYSAQYIERLIVQGIESASQAVANFEEKTSAANAMLEQDAAARKVVDIAPYLRPL